MSLVVHLWSTLCLQVKTVAAIGPKSPERAPASMQALASTAGGCGQCCAVTAQHIEYHVWMCTGFDKAVVEQLAADMCLPFVPARNKFEAISAHDALVNSHGALNTLAVSLMKVRGGHMQDTGDDPGYCSCVLPEQRLQVMIL